MSGSGSTLTSPQIDVGVNGKGNLNITSNGKVDSDYCYVADQSGSTGKVTVSAGGNWSVGTLYLGFSGAGTLNISGGTVGCSTSFLGFSGGSSTVSVDGGSSSWSTGSLYGGESGNATISITNGGKVTSAFGSIGYCAGTTGTMTVSGSSSTWTVTGSMGIGVGGTGRLYINGGGKVTAKYTSINAPSLLSIDASSANSLNGGDLTVLGTLTQTGGTVTITSLTQSGGTASFGGAQVLYSIPSVSISAGTTTFTADARKVLVASSLTLSGTGKLDLTKGGLLFHSTTANLSSDRAALQVDVNAGMLRSSLASTTTMLALMDGGDYLSRNGGTATFLGQPVTSTDLLVRYTYAGDINFDGVVDLHDFRLMDAGYLAGYDGAACVACWRDGDFSGDGIVDVSDFGLAVANISGTALGDEMHALYANEFGATFAQTFDAAVPEPGSLSGLLVGAVSALILRRRRRSERH